MVGLDRVVVELAGGWRKWWGEVGLEWVVGGGGVGVGGGGRWGWSGWWGEVGLEKVVGGGGVGVGGGGRWGWSGWWKKSRGKSRLGKVFFTSNISTINLPLFFY